jgi:hypothetical protein
LSNGLIGRPIGKGGKGEEVEKKDPEKGENL